VKRVRLLLLLPLIALDCLANMLLGQSWRNTLSGEAWNHRNDPRLRWCYRFIDGLPVFGAGHCRVQAEREERFGSVWNSWLNDWKVAGNETLNRSSTNEN
jgi:hypothetical protein